MNTYIKTIALEGIATKEIDVEVHIANGLPSFNIVGMAEKSVSESKERLRAAFSSIGLGIPAKRITINLSPANIIKEGNHFDLPIAIALLSAMEIIEVENISEFIALGEISLNGTIKPCKGTFAAAIHAIKNSKGLIFPQKQSQDIEWIESIEALPAKHLQDIIAHFTGKGSLNLLTKGMQHQIQVKHYTDFAHIKGQENAKYGAIIAAAGGHNMLMVGPPGSGKSMIASAISSILPKPTSEEILEMSLIKSIVGKEDFSAISYQRPFRSPHHSSSSVALVGGGKKIMPGEITLAHGGVLFLDELPEFNKNVLETLRQPMENKEITIARANGHINFPARFQLIAAMNPCKCGHVNDPEKSCSKAPLCASEYQSKLSGPLLDRIDMIIHVPLIKVQEIEETKTSQPSHEILKIVENARNIQAKRFENIKGVYSNSDATTEIIEKIFALETKAKEALLRATEVMRLSTRTYYRLQRVARTIADIQNSTSIKKEHIASAISFKQNLI